MGLLTLSSFATKLLSFFLVPLYTAILTTQEYGTYDVISSTVNFLIPILTINIYEAVLRYAMDKESDPKTVFSIGCKYAIWGNVIVVILLVFNHIARLSAILDAYSIFFALLFFVTVFSGIITSMARGLDRIADISISSVLCSVVMIFLNIFLLCVLKIGIYGYFIANISGILIQNIYLTVRIKGWNYITKTREYNSALEKEMIHYSLPTIANAISWWVNGLADRYVIIFFCGIASNGVYSVASKIPSILNIFQNIFSQAWMLSAVREFDAEDKNGFFAQIFNLYNAMLVIVCSMIICADKMLAHYLYSNDFYIAWKYVPFLTISIIFGALSGYAGSIFAALKHSDYFAKCSGAGAITNIALNLIMTPFIGPLGAAIATAISYWVVYVVSMWYLKKSIKLTVHILRDNISYLVLMMQGFFLLIIEKEKVFLYGIQLICIVIIIVLYYHELKMIVYRIVKKLRGSENK